MMHSLYAIADMGNGRELLKLYVEEINDINQDGTIKRAYQLQNIENKQLKVRSSGQALSSINATAYINNISQLFAAVKRLDKNFQPRKSSKIVNEDGTPKIVYHGTDSNFTVFNTNKTRSNMDIKGSFFSPWEIDAQSYGEKVGAYYLSIKNPADEGTAYRALNRFAGQEDAGTKARDFLIQLGYGNNKIESVGYDAQPICYC